MPKKEDLEKLRNVLRGKIVQLANQRECDLSENYDDFRKDVEHGEVTGKPCRVGSSYR